MSKSLSDRIQDSFSDDEASYASDYVRELQTSIRDSHQRIRNTTFLILISASLAELLARSAISQFSIGPFQVKDLSLIQKVIPIVLAYLLLEQHVLTLHTEAMESVYSEIVDYFHPKISENNLKMYLAPSMTLLWTAGMEGTRDARLATFQDSVGGLLTLLLMGALFIFEIYLFVVLFRTYGFTDALVWISVVLSTIFILLIFRAWAASFADTRQDIGR